eukprot:g10808.t1 g10808   contig4:2606217-2607755(-)
MPTRLSPNYHGPCRRRRRRREDEESLIGTLEYSRRAGSRSNRRRADNNERRDGSWNSTDVLFGDNDEEYATDEDDRIIDSILPEKYWLGCGFNNHNAMTMVQFQRHLKQQLYNIKRMRRQNGPVSVWISSYKNIPINYADAVRCPLFEKLYRKLYFCGDDRISELYFNNFELNTVALATLTPVVYSKKLTSLCLANNGLERDGFIFLSRFLYQNSTLKSLLLYDNSMDGLDNDTMECLAKAIKRHPSINRVVCEGCKLGNNTDTLLTFVCGVNGKKSLSFRKNNIGGSQSIRALVGLIKSARVGSLDLSDNDVNDGNIFHLARALENNSHLDKLFLSGNRVISAAGRKALQTASWDTKSLNAVADSNHTCRIEMFGDHGDARLIFNNLLDIGKTTKFIAEFKVFVTLGASLEGDLSIERLSGTPLELIPQLIRMVSKASYYQPKFFFPGEDAEFSRDVCDEAIDLKNVYEVLRKYAVPLMFRMGG